MIDNTVPSWTEGTLSSYYEKVRNSCTGVINYKVPPHIVSIVYNEIRVVNQVKEVSYESVERALRSHRWGNRHVRGAYRRNLHIYTAEDRILPPVYLHYEKKELSEDEIRRREWRRKVKDPRDQSLDKAHKKYICNYGRRQERRYVKNKLKQGIWEKYPNSRLYWETNRVCNGECCDHIPESWDYNYPSNEWDSYYDRHRSSFVDRWAWDW